MTGGEGGLGGVGARESAGPLRGRPDADAGLEPAGRAAAAALALSFLPAGQPLRR